MPKNPTAPASLRAIAEIAPRAHHTHIGQHVEDVTREVKGLVAVLVATSTAIPEAKVEGEDDGLTRVFILPKLVSTHLDQGMTTVLEALDERLNGLVDIAYRDTRPEAEARFAAARDAVVQR